MPFACCFSCGSVVDRPRGAAIYGEPAGACPKCGRTMYWTPTPFAEIASRHHALATRKRVARGEEA